MNAARRTSFSARGDAALHAPQPNRPHVDDTAIRLDYNLRHHGPGAEQSTFKTTTNYAPGGSAFQQYRDDDAKPYAHLDMPSRTPNPFADIPALSFKRTRRWWERAAVIALAVCFVLFWLGKSVSRSQYYPLESGTRIKPLRHTTPLPSFRDNLWEDSAYVTTFPYGGLTNQLLEAFKLVHLGHRLDRTAILPDLTAVHAEGTNTPFSSFYDLAPFSDAANVTVTEWSKVKMQKIDGPVAESLSCWGNRPYPEWDPLAEYKIRTTFWPPPKQLTVQAYDSRALSFPAIEVLVSSDQTEYLQSVQQEVIGSTATLPDIPDQQVLCISNLFYVKNAVRFVHGQVDGRYTIEELDPTDPIWHDIGRHLHFNKATNKIADDILSYLLGPSYTPPALRHASIEPSKKLVDAGTPFIGVHLRQGDFIQMARAGHPLSAYATAVDLLQARLALLLRPSKHHFNFGSTKKGDKISVLFTTDSKEPEFIESLTRLGWTFIDHDKLKTVKRYGGWYPAVIDSLILSRGVGFVGTKQSTFSYVAARRVETWSNGLTSIVGDAPHPLLLPPSHYEDTRKGRNGKPGAAGRNKLNP